MITPGLSLLMVLKINNRNYFNLSIFHLFFMKKCPFCSEDIQDSAKKCKHCWEFLDNSPNNKEYLSFNYSFELEDWRAQFVEFMEKEAWIHDVTFRRNTRTETSWWWSGFFDKYTVSPIQTRTIIDYELSFKIEKNSPFANKEFVNQCFRYFNLTYSTGFWWFFGFVVMFWICIAIVNGGVSVLIDLIWTHFGWENDLTIILSPIFYYLMRKLILFSRMKTCRDSKNYYKKKIDAFLKK